MHHLRIRLPFVVGLVSICRRRRRRPLGMSPSTQHPFLCFLSSRHQRLSPQCPPIIPSINLRLIGSALLSELQTLCAPHLSRIVSVYLGKMRRSPAGPLSSGRRAPGHSLTRSHLPNPVSRVTRRACGQASISKTYLMGGRMRRRGQSRTRGLCSPPGMIHSAPTMRRGKFIDKNERRCFYPPPADDCHTNMLTIPTLN